MKPHPTARLAVLLATLSFVSSGVAIAQPAPATRPAPPASHPATPATAPAPATQPAPARPATRPAPAAPATQPARRARPRTAAKPAPRPEPALGDSAYETVVVGRALPRGASVQEVGQTEIERQGVLSAAEVLERTPAIHASTGQRGERVFAMRGFDQRQVAVLLDGAPFYVTYDGQVDLAMVPALALDHITVVKGPSSVLFGPNGLGGAVNLVTRRPGAGPFVSALFEGAPAAAVRLAASHSASAGRWSWALYGGFDWRDHWPLAGGFQPTTLQGEGDRLNSGRKMWNAGGDVSVRLGAHQVRATVLAVDGGRGVPPSTVDPTPRYWRFNTWRAIATSLAHELRTGAWDVDNVFYVRLFDNLLDSYDDATYTTQSSSRAFHTWYHDRVIGARARSQYRRARTPLGTIFLRGWLGFQEDLHDDIPGGTAPTTSYSRTLVTAAPEVEVDPTPRWRVLASCQVDADIPGRLSAGSVDTAWGVGPLASVQYSPWKSTTLRLAVARRTRFPALKERFASAGGLRTPNPGLRPEAAWHVGLDASYRLAPFLRLDASIYDAEVTDLIEIVSLGEGKDQMQNVATARLLGAELLLASRPVRFLELQAGYSWLHARRTGSGPADQLGYRPAHRALGSVVVTPWSWLEVSALLRVFGPQDYQDPMTRAWGVLGAYALLDARLEVRPLRVLAVWVRGTNLIDTHSQSEYGFPDPGRVVWLGLKLTGE